MSEKVCSVKETRRARIREAYDRALTLVKQGKLKPTEVRLFCFISCSDIPAPAVIAAVNKFRSEGGCR